MIYQITIIHPKLSDPFVLYAHPDWDRPLNRGGDPVEGWKVIFTLSEDAARDGIRPMVFTESAFSKCCIKIAAWDGDLNTKRTYIRSIVRLDRLLNPESSAEIPIL